MLFHVCFIKWHLCDINFISQIRINLIHIFNGAQQTKLINVSVAEVERNTGGVPSAYKDHQAEKHGMRGSQLLHVPGEDIRWPKCKC